MTFAKIKRHIKIWDNEPLIFIEHINFVSFYHRYFIHILWLPVLNLIRNENYQNENYHRGSKQWFFFYILYVLIRMWYYKLWLHHNFTESHQMPRINLFIICLISNQFCNMSLFLCIHFGFINFGKMPRKKLSVISQQVAFLEKFQSKLEKFHSKLEKFHSKLEKFQSNLEKFYSKLKIFHSIFFKITSIILNPYCNFQ